MQFSRSSAGRSRTLSARFKPLVITSARRVEPTPVCTAAWVGFCGFTPLDIQIDHIAPMGAVSVISK